LRGRQGKSFAPPEFPGKWRKMNINQLSSKIIGAAIEVHKALGPGLLESTYEESLSYELDRRGLFFDRQKSLPIV
jgi:hypothetical protein